jgi:hypothetical protein
MSDFKTALCEGFQAADDAERARKDIKDVFARLKEDVLAATDGKVLIELGQFEVTTQPLTTMEQIIRSANFSPLNPRPPRETYRAVAAKNPLVDSSFKELAKWKQSRDGFPCTISWAGQERHSMDRAGLEDSLAELLRDAGIGAILRGLMKLSDGDQSED